MRTIRTAMTILVLAAAITPVMAQSGGLTVKVVDATDQSPLPGATVILTNAVQLISETVVQTNIDGLAEFPILRPGGGYIVEVQMPGFAGVRKDDIRVKINDNQVIPIPLGAEITEVEQVVATRDVVDLEKTQTSTTFGDEFIQDLPVQGRFYTNVLTLAPGVQDSDGDGNPNVHGARERDFAAIVGGVSNVDPLTGLRLNNVNIDSIEEIEVITAGAGVEYGRAQGGFANVIEKQGSNEFEGLFNFIYRSSKLDGDGAASNLRSDQVPDFDWFQPAIQVSGPFIRDKLWYRFSFEYLKREDPVNTTNTVAVTTTTRITSSNMVTWQASRRNKLAFSYLDDPLEVENVGVSSTRPTQSTWTTEFGGPTYRMQWTAPYSPKLLVDSTVAYQDSGLTISPTQRGVNNACINGLDVLESAQCFDLVTGQVSGSYNQDWDDDRQRFTVKTQANIFGGRFWGMSHQFKLGFTVENERYSRTLERRPFMTFFEVGGAQDPTGQGGVEPVGIVNANLAIPTISEAKATGTNWAFYAEDQLRPASNLTITLGGRVDFESISSDGYLPFDPEAEGAAFVDALAQNPINPTLVTINAFTAFEDIEDFTVQLANILNIPPSQAFTKLESASTKSRKWTRTRRPENVDIENTNFSPFLSLSWDPFRTNKTRIAASAGRHYDKIFLGIPLVELEPVTTDLNFRANRVGGEWTVNEVCQGSGGCLRPSANVSTVSRDLETPYQDEFTLTFERELAAETALSLTYINRQFENQFQDIDLNHIAGDFGRCQLQTSPGVMPLIPSPGEGQMLVDPFSGQEYIDTDPGDGDGRFDDCMGEFEQNFGGGGGGGGGSSGLPPTFDGLLVRPDGFPDSYVQNPGWGEIFLIGNFNTTEYEAFVLELTRRQYRNWQMNASYTWSEAIGDAEDFNQILGDDRTIIGDERGYLSYDQRHSVKVNATSIVPWAGGFRFGTAIQWTSGYPFSLRRRGLSIDAVPPQYAGIANPESRARLRYVTGQRNDQRNESWWNFDVHLAKEFNLQGGMNAQVTFDIFNLLNDDDLRIFNQDNGFNTSVRRFGRRFQIGLRLAF